MGIVDLWNTIILQPMLNGLIILYGALFHNFGLAIVIFTVAVRLAMLPLTLKQLRASKAMQELQPKLQDVQKRYKSDRQRLAQETTRLYREHGVNPLGCALPMVLQFPIWIALYQSIIQALAFDPQSLFSLSGRLYPWTMIHEAVPLGSRFLWLDLARPDQYSILAVLVGVSMWVQQKMIMTQAMDERQASMNRMMLWMMPVMFGFFTLQFASGLAIYWLISNVVGIVMQYFITGWGGLADYIPARWGGKVQARALAPAGGRAAQAEAGEAAPTGRAGKRAEDGRGGSKRKVRRRSSRRRT
ncbi:MAG: membrane protein insertase YidC [Chloroflexi bacterium]|nr:membrane protein insertase YidC [Chloroflexota bacterium]